MKERYNSVIMGANLGILVPIMSIYCWYLIKFSHRSFDQFIDMISDMYLLPKVISVSMLANLALFFLFLQFKMYKAGNGVILATFIFGAIILYYKIQEWTL